MAYDRLTTIPVAITAGTTIRLDLNYGDIPASEGGSLAIYLRGAGTIPDADFVYGVDGDAWTIDVLSTKTTNWPAGVFGYTIFHTAAGGAPVNKVTSGRIEILADPANITTIEARTDTEITLARLKDLMKEMSQDQYKTVQVRDKIYSQRNIKDLYELIKEYENRLYFENQAELAKQGKNRQLDVVFEFNDNI